MPHITDQEKLKRDFTLVLVSVGPKDGAWRAPYLKCPLCGYFVLKGNGYDECTCGNILVDSDMLRVSVCKTPESAVETYDATKKNPPGKKGLDDVRAALSSLVTANDGGFVTFNERTSGKFVQFAMTPEKGLLLDLPAQTLDAGELERANVMFKRLGVQLESSVFNLGLERDVDRATAFTRQIFTEIYRFGPELELIISED